MKMKYMIITSIISGLLISPAFSDNFEHIASQLNLTTYQSIAPNRNDQFTQNKDLFRGKIKRVYLQSENAKSFDLVINDTVIKVNINKNKSVNIEKLTRNGLNTFEIKNIRPKNAKVEAHLPFPTLTVGSPGSVGFSQKRLDKIDQLINNEVKAGFPGGVLVVIKDSKIIKQTAYGYQRKYADGVNEQLATLLPTNQFEKTTVNTMYDMASNTKMYAVNFAIMHLVSQGKLNIDLPIQHYIPEYTGDGRDAVTTRDILTHSAGYAPEVLFFDHERTTDNMFSQNATLTKELILTKVPFVYKRGTKSIYSDTDYMLAGIVIERITGQALDDYVENNIYKPLALTNTLYTPLKKGMAKTKIAATELNGNSRDGLLSFSNIRRQVIQGQVHDEKAFYSMEGISGHAGLFSTAKEIATLASVIINGGGYGKVKLFDRDVIDQFTKPSNTNITFGTGWRRAGNRDKTASFGAYASPLTIGHTGWTGSNTIIDPANNLVIVLLTNKKHSPVINNKVNPNHFKGDTFNTGGYGSIITLVYDAFINADK